MVRGSDVQDVIPARGNRGNEVPGGAEPDHRAEMVLDAQSQVTGRKGAERRQVQGDADDVPRVQFAEIVEVVVVAGRHGARDTSLSGTRGWRGQSQEIRVTG